MTVQSQQNDVLMVVLLIICMGMWCTLCFMHAVLFQHVVMTSCWVYTSVVKIAIVHIGEDTASMQQGTKASTQVTCNLKTARCSLAFYRYRHHASCTKAFSVGTFSIQSCLACHELEVACLHACLLKDKQLANHQAPLSTDTHTILFGMS